MKKISENTPWFQVLNVVVKGIIVAAIIPLTLLYALLMLIYLCLYPFMDEALKEYIKDDHYKTISHSYWDEVYQFFVNTVETTTDIRL